MFVYNINLYTTYLKVYLIFDIKFFRMAVYYIVFLCHCVCLSQCAIQYMIFCVFVCIIVSISLRVCSLSVFIFTCVVCVIVLLHRVCLINCVNVCFFCLLLCACHRACRCVPPCVQVCVSSYVGCVNVCVCHRVCQLVFVIVCVCVCSYDLYYSNF